MKVKQSTCVLALMAMMAMMLFVTAVWAQSVPVPSNNLSGTITISNTFQVVQAQANNRIGCTIQNNASIASGDIMYVFFDKSNSANCSAATEAASFQRQPGDSIHCLVGSNTTLKDQVCITGTAGDSFTANFQ